MHRWATLWGFPTEDSGALPFMLDGSSLAGVTMYGDIASDGTSLGRAGYYDLGGGLRYDHAKLVFPIVRRDFAVTYEFYNRGANKHWWEVRASDIVLDAALVIFGSWDNKAILGAGMKQTATMCQLSWPPGEVPNIDMGTGAWKTRTMVKKGRFWTYQDDSYGPISVKRCYLPVRGHIALTLGPYVRVKNIVISEV